MISPDNSWGVELPNHTWNGAIGVIEKGDADVSNTGLVATPARMRVVDFLSPIAQMK
jgi:hypothetical protein